ncbi:uncharacterized protein LOC110857255 [Folsomia candida]|uniref:uncharacterized protein LOC110857255 n=1 Tax=Folsomia candida TaxID=158441 RepID=UPI000B901ABF|nr:uncharacterized protein LOC110857255 [Folsomia candida]
MNTTEAKALRIQFLLFLVGSQSNIRSLNPGNIEIHVTNDTIHTYHVDRCIPFIPKSESGDINGIQTYGNCINIYSKENCVGQFVRLQSGAMIQFVYFKAVDSYAYNILDDHEKMMVGSIGPCLEKCDPQNWAGMRSHLSTKFTLYEEADYTGIGYTYSISGKACLTTPQVPLESIRFLRTEKNTTACVELHDDPKCGGNSVQLRPGYPYLHRIWWWGFHRGQGVAIFAKSVSLCGYSCPTGMNSFSTTTVIKPTTTTPTTTTRTKPTGTTPLEEPVTSQSNLQIHEKASNSQEERPREEQPTDLPVWGMMFIVLAILLIAVFGGIYFFQRYRNVHPPKPRMFRRHLQVAI